MTVQKPVMMPVYPRQVMPSELGISQPAEYRHVYCPMCMVGPGEKCRSRASRFVREVHYVHAERVTEATDDSRQLRRERDARMAIERRRSDPRQDL